MEFQRAVCKGSKQSHGMQNDEVESCWYHCSADKQKAASRLAQADAYDEISMDERLRQARTALLQGGLCRQTAYTWAVQSTDATFPSRTAGLVFTTSVMENTTGFLSKTHIVNI